MTFPPSLRRLFLCAAATLLAGCAGIAPRPAAQNPAASLPRVYHDSIDIGGRLSLQYLRNGERESLHGNFDWEQTPAHTAITVRSPLGQTLAAIDIAPQSSTLRQSGKPPATAADVDALVARALGWPLPISGLRDWLQGFAIDAQGQPFVASPQGPDAVTTSDGWRIRYIDWQDGGAGLPPRPKRIDLAHPTAQAGDVSLRIAIGEWQPH